MQIRPAFSLSLCALTAAVVAGCGGNNIGLPFPTPTPTSVANTRLNFDFNNGAQGWTPFFADLPVNYDRNLYALRFTAAALPAPLSSTRRSLLLGGTNRSDDLWMGLKRRVSGLRPNARYRVRGEVEFASNAPNDSVGVGGSPGASVYVKLGASPREPLAITQGDDLRLNVDKGDQSQAGSEAIVLGTVGITRSEPIYTLKSLSNPNAPLLATTDNAGNLWLFFGTDSAFESRTELFYTRFNVSLEAI